MDNYTDYIKQFKVYSTQKAAQKKGFEAHHVLPKAMQKDSTEFDDRCVRLTPFEHIYAHYLLALENEEGARIFLNMYSFRQKNLTSLEQITLEELEDWTRVIEEGRQKQSESMKGENNHMYGRTGEKAPMYMCPDRQSFQMNNH